MENENTWVAVAIASIWISVVFTSLFSADLVSGAEQSHIRVAALVNWLWGGLATAFVLRATVFFSRRTEVLESWMWIGISVAAIWLAVIFVSILGPDLVISGTDPITIPIAAVLSPIVAVVLTKYVSEFLVTGFASRNQTLR